MPLSAQEERWALTRAPEIAENFDALEDIDARQWSIGQTNYARNNELLAEKYGFEATIGTFDRTAEAYGYTDLAGKPSLDSEIGRLQFPDAGNSPAQDISVRRAAEKGLARVLKAMAKHRKDTAIPPGRASWAEKMTEAHALIARLTKSDAPVEVFKLSGQPSRKKMKDSGKAADAAHAEREKVRRSHPPLEEAIVLARAAVRSTPPLKVALNDFYIAHEARVPTVALSWRDGNTAPSAIDLSHMLGWLAGQRIEDEILAQLERRYNDFADRGIMTMSASTRRRELARLDGVVHQHELEEAANMLGIMAAEPGVMFYPPARMSAASLLGIV